MFCKKCHKRKFKAKTLNELKNMCACKESTPNLTPTEGTEMEAIANRIHIAKKICKAVNKTKKLRK